jgi:hypothetical protein
MKIRISTLFFLLIISVSCYAQKFKIGIKGGGNLSNLGTENAVVDKQTRAGYHIGFSGSYDLATFGIQPELLYSTQGGEISLPGLTYEEQYDYLSIPITLKFYIGSGFNVHFGPYFAILMKATQRETSGTDETVNNIDEFISNTDYGFFSGVGYDLNESFNFEARYSYGMKDVDSFGNNERRNRVFQVSMTYFFLK